MDCSTGCAAAPVDDGLAVAVGTGGGFIGLDACGLGGGAVEAVVVSPAEG